MKYNDVLTKMPEVVRKLNTKDNPDYKLPESFKIITEMLKIESVCNKYFIRINDLTEEELDVFTNLSKNHTQTKNKLIEEYERLFMIGIINNNDFLENYDNWTDYVIAFILNELKDKFLSVGFNDSFNKEVGFNALSSSADLLLFLKRQDTLSYKKLKSNPYNLNHSFKSCLKEFQILGEVIDKNGLDGICEYIRILIDVENGYDLEDNIIKFLQRSEINDGVNHHAENKFHKSLIDIYLELEKNELWFANHNLSLMIDLTSKDSAIRKISSSDKNICATNAFLNYLCDKDFYSSVVSNEYGIPHFKDISNLIQTFLENGLKIDSKLTNGYELLHVSKEIKNICDDVISGKLKVGKSGYGSK